MKHGDDGFDIYIASKPRFHILELEPYRRPYHLNIKQGQLKERKESIEKKRRVDRRIGSMRFVEFEQYSPTKDEVGGVKGSVIFLYSYPISFVFHSHFLFISSPCVPFCSLIGHCTTDGIFFFFAFPLFSFSNCLCWGLGFIYTCF